MMRTVFWLATGAVAGLIIHLVVILSLPAFASRDAWSRITALDSAEHIVVLDQVEAGAANPFGLDPLLAYATCRLDLSQGPGSISGQLPDAFWSVSIYDRSGVSLYSTTNRSGIGQVVDVGIFNPAQTRLLAEQQLQISEGLIIVEAPGDDVFAVIRIAPAHAEMLPRYREALKALRCVSLRSRPKA